MIKMTDRAAQKLKSVLRSNSLPEDTVLRLDVEHGEKEEDMRLALKLDDQEPGTDDEVEATEGARLAVHKELARAIGDAQLDFREEAGGFVFQRPEPTH